MVFNLVIAGECLSVCMSWQSMTSISFFFQGLFFSLSLLSCLGNLNLVFPEFPNFLLPYFRLQFSRQQPLKYLVMACVLTNLF